MMPRVKKTKEVAKSVEWLFSHQVKQMHAYDLTHLPALAIDKASSADRAAVIAAWQ